MAAQTLYQTQRPCVKDTLTTFLEEVLSHIRRCTKDLGYCRAKNTYFMKQYGVTERTVTRWTTTFERLNKIRTERVGNERRIYVYPASTQSLSSSRVRVQRTKSSTKETKEKKTTNIVVPSATPLFHPEKSLMQIREEIALSLAATEAEYNKATAVQNRQDGGSTLSPHGRFAEESIPDHEEDAEQIREAIAQSLASAEGEAVPQKCGPVNLECLQQEAIAGIPTAEQQEAHTGTGILQVQSEGITNSEEVLRGEEYHADKKRIGESAGNHSREVSGVCQSNGGSASSIRESNSPRTAERANGRAATTATPTGGDAKIALLTAAGVTIYPALLKALSETPTEAVRAIVAYCQQRGYGQGAIVTAILGGWTVKPAVKPSVSHVVPRTALQPTTTAIMPFHEESREAAKGLRQRLSYLKAGVSGGVESCSAI